MEVAECVKPLMPCFCLHKKLHTDDGWTNHRNLKHRSLNMGVSWPRWIYPTLYYFPANLFHDKVHFLDM
jgi:hypothetical protein